MLIPKPPQNVEFNNPALQKITFNKHLLTIVPLIFFFHPLYILNRCNINYLLHQLIIVVNNRR